MCACVCLSLCLLISHLYTTCIYIERIFSSFSSLSLSLSWYHISDMYHGSTWKQCDARVESTTHLSLASALLIEKYFTPCHPWRSGFLYTRRPTTLQATGTGRRYFAAHKSPGVTLVLLLRQPQIYVYLCIFFHIGDILGRYIHWHACGREVVSLTAAGTRLL